MSEKRQPKATIVIFGATGDLAKRKLFPSIYNLYKKGKLSENFAVVGLARRPWTDEILRENVEQSIKQASFSSADEDLREFTSHFYYNSFDVTDDSTYDGLNKLMIDLEDKYQTEGNRLFYLAMAPNFFGLIAKKLKEYGLKESSGWTRLIIEKPFGTNLSSAKELNNEIREAFDEDQIYRIDHYLGKEMVQNIEVIRFANGIFEHLWNNQYISNIQITASETLGVEERARYYDESGAVRDMLQNHILQMVALLLMEPPIKLTTDEIRSEKIKVLRALRKIDSEKIDKYFVRGQYDSGEMNGEALPSYREEDEQLANSTTETYVAGKLVIDNYRWAGVPIYVRTGKRMAKKTIDITIQFKDLPMNLYYKSEKERHPNLLSIKIQPDEGITLSINANKAGAGSLAEPVQLSLNNNDVPGINTPEAYEKLLYDCTIGDATNFTHWDEVALSWEFVDPILETWAEQQPNFPNYKSGSMGPKEADELLERDGNHWWDV
ncbi:glucose-6-phosphate dehydrogenase [Oceanobacillus halophilus]|uniref:Glucose-6-phosphate 1-dehydrogenase n=1 Tax=Oceanobacillus halophilus TaxID=930130 RepID=A0A495A7M2_9BACI|nr:glucose-6-phosphate dehydrogenase [Oceanobacillus halophilus]RKQ34344.1 glucose-6-phosphate dehydrogenase [Oceanobacillus halophilus]